MYALVRHLLKIRCECQTLHSNKHMAEQFFKQGGGFLRGMFPILSLRLGMVFLKTTERNLRFEKVLCLSWCYVLYMYSRSIYQETGLNMLIP